MKRWENIYKPLPAIGFLAFLILFWEIIARITEIPTYILPMPTDIVRALSQNAALLFLHSQATLLAALSGLGIAVVLSVVIAYVMDKIEIIKKMFYPLLVISQTIPIIAIAPIMIIWFGFGYLPKILTVVLVCFFPLTVSITEGLKKVEKEDIEVLKVIGAKTRQIFWHIQLPAILPFFFSGLKISVTYSVMAAVIGEWLGGNRGIGVFMIRSMHTYNISNLFSAILVVVVLSVILFKVTEFISWLVMPWERKEES